MDEEPLKCYAVVSGEYSDYMVHAIYAHREDAVAEILRHRQERKAQGLSTDGYGEREIEVFDFWPGDTPIRPVN